MTPGISERKKMPMGDAEVIPQHNTASVVKTVTARVALRLPIGTGPREVVFELKGETVGTFVYKSVDGFELSYEWAIL